MSPTPDMGAPQRNPKLVNLVCIQCGQVWPIGDYPQGCALCWKAGIPSNLLCVYDDRSRSLQLPYINPLTLGEGDSPLVALPVKGALLALLEGSNPTGSHKDRYSAQAVSHALASGYSRVLAASSGNAGVSIAAYAARAGMRCEIVVTPEVPRVLKDAIADTGAIVRVVGNGAARWDYIRHEVDRDPKQAISLTNTAVPVVGSSAFGIEGYKTVALELISRLGDSPHHVVVPTSRGDLLWGAWLGFLELSSKRATRLPKMHCVEPIPRAAAVVNQGRTQGDSFAGDPGLLVSIAGDSVTYQTLAAVMQSNGSAVVVRPKDAEHAAEWLRRRGFLVEISSAAALSAYFQLLSREVISTDETCVIILTSHMFKGL